MVSRLLGGLSKMKTFLKGNGLFLLCAIILIVLLVQVLMRETPEKGDWYLITISILGILSSIVLIYRRCFLDKKK